MVVSPAATVTGVVVVPSSDEATQHKEPDCPPPVEAAATQREKHLRVWVAADRNLRHPNLRVREHLEQSNERSALPPARLSLYWHPISCPIETPTKWRGGAVKMTVSPTACGACAPRALDDRKPRRLGQVIHDRDDISQRSDTRAEKAHDPLYVSKNRQH